MSTSARGAGSFRRSMRVTPASVTPFTRAFSSVASSAARSESTAVTGANPSRAAASASTPDPQPRSASEPRGSSPSSNSSDSRVVGCAPVPKARPGSTTSSARPGSSAGGSQGGRTRSRPPTTTGLWKRRQRSAQSSATSSPLTLTRTPATSASPRGNAGSSPGAP